MTSKRQSLISAFDEKEKLLRDVLLETLPLVVNGEQTFFFFAERFNPWPQLASKESKKAITILRLADEIVALADQCELTEFPSFAKTTLSAFARAANLADHHRGSEATIAKDLLKEIEGAGTAYNFRY